jgi:hypothetical protein
MLIMKSSLLAFKWKLGSNSLPLYSGIGRLVNFNREKLQQRRLFATDDCYSSDLNWRNYVNSRDWDSVNKFWKRMIQTPDQKTLPSYIKGNMDSVQHISIDPKAIAYNSFQYDRTDLITPKITTDDTITNGFGIANLRPVHKAGFVSEFHSNDSRYKHDITLALKIGYVGDNFYGYQYQKEFLGVENALRNILKKEIKTMKSTTFGCGRTDRGVHAISQIVTFTVDQYNKKQLTKDDLFKHFEESGYYCNNGGNEEGKALVLYDCYRVPKRFHARSSAFWRRYLYLFPLQQGENPLIKEEQETSGAKSFDEGDADVDDDADFLSTRAPVSAPNPAPLMSLEDAIFNLNHLNRILSQ